MSEASIETTLELWVSSLRNVKARIRPVHTGPNGVVGGVVSGRAVGIR